MVQFKIDGCFTLNGKIDFTKCVLFNDLESFTDCNFEYVFVEY